MTSTRWALVALLLLALPTAAAEPAPTKGEVRLDSQPNALRMTQTVEWEKPANGTYTGIARFFVPVAATNVQALIELDNTTASGPSNAVKESSGVEGYDLYRVDAKTSLNGRVPTERFAVSLAYDVPAPGATERTYYAYPRLTLWIQLRPGEDANSDYFTDFIPAGTNTYHTWHDNVPGNQTFQVNVGHTSAASQDQSRWLWAGLGLLAGLILMMAAVRMGWVKSRPRGSKFEKGGALESRTMLEARRRTLLAALKELEHGHESKEILDDAYAPLKEEYKAQAVRVMRNLEEKKEG